MAAAAIAIFVIWVARRGGSSDQVRPDAPPPHGQEQTDARTQVTIDPARSLPQAPPIQAKTPPEPAPPSGVRTVKKFHARLLTDTAGAPISSSNRSAWLEARRLGVTATDAGKIVKLDGTFSSQRAGLLEAKLCGREPAFQQVMQHGIDREPVIAAWVAEQFGIQPNNFICRGDNHRHLATPDGIGPGVVAEIKTSTKPLAQTLGIYRDQLQWQLHVTGSERLLFVVENRHTLRRETTWVERDDYRIFMLTQHAEAFLQEMDARRVALRAPVAEPRQELHTVMDKMSPETHPVSLVSAVIRGTAAPCGSATQTVDEDETRPWSEPERRDLLAGYSRGESIATLASRTSATRRAVVFELTRLMLAPEGPMVDRAAGKFGHFWSTADEKILRDLYSTGTTLLDIARELKRDQLGVAFKLLENAIPHPPEADVPLVEPMAAAVLGTSSVVESAAVPVLPKSASSSPAPRPSQLTAAGGAVSVPSQPSSLRRMYDPVPPETLVGNLDPDNDSEDNRVWPPHELRRLIHIYRDNEDLEVFEIARHFRTTSRSVVITLTRLLLEPHGALEDTTCPKHRKHWTQGEVDLVHDSFSSGATLFQIAQTLGRDQLSVAFKLFGERLPEVSALPDELRLA